MIKLIPQPFKYSVEAGSFNMHKGFTISYPNIWKSEVVNFIDYTEKYELKASKDSLNTIDIVVDDRLAREGYLINVGNNNITISASTSTGCFYALTSLKQLITAYNAIIPCFQIEDRPRFNYRGFMLDVSRYFYSVEDVKKILDLMALHKLNYFHWHLTDDQGWRIEIDKYPLLTEEGSKRSHTNFNLKEHKGFYTKDDIKEVVRYAHSLHINVVPEVDMPGHMQAALHAYPELGCFDRKLPVATHWGIKHDILCGGKAIVMDFVRDVIDELVYLFPDKLIHIGGDEAVKTRWELCPHCQRVIKKYNLKDENALQAAFINEVNAYITSKGYSTIMWHVDSLADKVSKNIITMPWDVSTANKHQVEQHLEKGRVMINASSLPNYLDLPYSKNSLKDVYKQDILGNSPSLIGIEAPLWTEFVPNLKKAYFMMFPRLGAISEVGWCEEKNRDYDVFTKKLPHYYEMLEIMGVYNIPKVKRANPSSARCISDNIWWSRRLLCWHGLHNLIDNAKVKKMAYKKYPDIKAHRKALEDKAKKEKKSK